MKKFLIPVALAALLPAVAQAQYYYDDYDWDIVYDEYVYVEDDYAPLTGDPVLDALLASIDARFNDEPVYYAEQLAVTTRLQPATLRNYLVNRRYAPSDVYMIGQLAQATGKSVSEVANAYDANRRQGWGVVARSLGIKPGSPEFHQLKRGNATALVSAPTRRAVAPGQMRQQPATAHPGKGHGKGKERGPGKAQGQGKGKGKGKNK